MQLLPELASFVENLSEPRILVDLDYRILVANRAYRERYSPRTSRSSAGTATRSHITTRAPAIRPASRVRAAAMASRAREHVLHVHHTPRGDEHVQVELNPMRDSSGEVRLFVERMESLPTARRRFVAGTGGRVATIVARCCSWARVAPTDTSVLLLGETGTGKEMVTGDSRGQPSRRGALGRRRLLRVSPRRCSRANSSAMRKGRSRAQPRARSGLVEAASGGTLFLDEVGDISLAQQVKLLRLIESSSYRRVGGVTPLRSDFRLVAATHRDLKAMVRAGTFRSDLYYRISAFPIHVPTLRERPDDIPLLAESLLGRIRPGRASRCPKTRAGRSSLRLSWQRSRTPQHHRARDSAGKRRRHSVCNTCRRRSCRGKRQPPVGLANRRVPRRGSGSRIGQADA